MREGVKQMNSAFRAGDRVRVKSAGEILATLDEHGRYEGLPFMEEMLEWCGKELPVVSTAHKTCDTVNKTGGRSLPGTVHLGDLRCSGASHGGCDAHCLLFWKDAWLDRADTVESAPVAVRPTREASDRLRGSRSVGATTIYSCQATDLPRFTRLLPWWDVRQYIADIRSGNQSVGEVLRIGVLKTIQNCLQIGVGYGVFLKLYNRLQSKWGGVPRSAADEIGTVPVGGRTPIENLDLVPGEMVEIKSYEEIRATLDRDSKNRGMRFDIEMRIYCGQQFRVAKRVSQILNEETGEMMVMKSPSVVLDGVYCRAKFSTQRMFCPRALPGFWREIWLRRVGARVIPVAQVN